MTPEDTDLQASDCSSCDGRLRVDADPPLLHDSVSKHIFAIFSELFQLLQMPKRKGPRLAAMIALKHLLLHAPSGEHHDLTKSIYGQWCLQALRASARELRIAAGYSNQVRFSVLVKLTLSRRNLSAFLQRRIKNVILHKNRRLILDCLRTLSANGDTMLHETCILAWGQVGR